MKNRYLFVVILLTIGFSSCEDYFEKEPLGTTYSEEYYQSMNDLQLGLNSVYNVLARDDFQRSEWMFGEGCGDDCNRVSGVSESSANGQLMQFTYASDNNLILERWEENYLGIFRANQVIVNAEKVEFISETGGEVKDIDYFASIVAQAKFLRGYFYFNLVKTYGAIPIKPDVLSFDDQSDNFVQPRSSVEDVYKYIEKDLREAIIGLSKEYVANDYKNIGKVEKGAAIALLIKVLAYQAEPGVSHENWHESLKFCRFLVDGGNMTNREILNYDELYEGEGWEEIAQMYKFTDETLDDIVSSINVYGGWTGFTYDKIWTWEGEFNPGSIFEVNHIESNDGTDNNNNLGSNLYNSLCNNAVPKIFQPVSSWKDGKNDDPRIMISVIQQGDVLPGSTEGASVGAIPSNSGCYKWYVMGDERPQGKDSDGARNYRISRMAEVILWYAEALNETGDPFAAVTQLNTIRERARLICDSDARWTGSKDKPAYLNPGTYFQVRDMVWNERRIELAFEFDRFFDIVRQGNATLLMAKFNSAFSEQYKKNYKEGVNEIFAIPQKEIDFSNGIVTQNPGY